MSTQKTRAAVKHFKRLAKRADEGRTISLKGMTDEEILALLRKS